jgi:hypothetical protein
VRPADAAVAEALAVARRPALRARLAQQPHRQTWLWTVVVVSVVAFVVAILSAPAADATPAQGLGWLLFVGSSVHIAGTGWLFTFSDVRRHVRQHRNRYVIAPISLVAAAAAVAVLLAPKDLSVLLLGYFAWQFFHYQKQNLGLAALSATCLGVASLRRNERRSIIATGWAGIAALMAHPGTLQLPIDPHLGWYPALPFAIASCCFAVGVGAGLLGLIRRSAADRPVGFCAVYLLALCFPLPIFVFSSPYAAVGGMTIAHGLQYLVLVGLVAVGPHGRRASVTKLTVFVTTALVGGLLLNLASHLHGGGGVARGCYGAYLGVVMSHFVVDAGIWRLRDPFPRQFLTARIPSVLGRSVNSPRDASSAGVGSAP